MDGPVEGSWEESKTLQLEKILSKRRKVKVALISSESSVELFDQGKTNSQNSVASLLWLRESLLKIENAKAQENEVNTSYLFTF